MACRRGLDCGCLPQNRSRALSCTRLGAASRLRTACLPFDHRQVTRQVASVFNQPLSFDTSSVTDMGFMFGVCAPPRALPPICGRALSCTLRAPRSCPPPPACQPVYLAPHSTCLLTRQQASAFNQPLSFDTSSTPEMSHMFRVRSVACPQLGTLHAAAAASCIPAHSSPRMPSCSSYETLGRAQTPCPTPTNCSSVAPGRASPLAMARAGLREAARRHRPRRSRRPRRLRLRLRLHRFLHHRHH